MNYNRHLRSGSALISTMLVITVLTIIVVAFLQSMTIERQTARSYLNRYKAELAARGGLAAFIDGVNNKGNTDLHFVLNSTNSQSEDEKINLTRQVTDTTDAASNIPLTTIASDTTRIQITETESSAPAVFRLAGYIPIIDNKGIEVARYAFWSEGENMKQNIKHAGASARDESASPTDLPVIKRDATAFQTADTSALNSSRAAILTPKTLNQVVTSLTPRADGFDYTLYSPTEKLTPEGWKKLNLTRLKRYIDGGDFYEDTDGDSKEELIASYPGLATTQGPTSPRFQLIQQLLNEDGAHPFHQENQENPWGPGNLEFLRKAYPTLDSAHGNVPNEARQAVANLIDYIDADFIPTTDGQLPTAPTLLSQADSSTASNQRTFNDTTYELPPISIFPAPSVLGVESKIVDTGPDAGKIKGHPYVNAVTVGLIFNPTGGSTTLNSARVLGDVLLANPWESDITWKASNSAGYFLEMQVKILGTVAQGTRGTEMHVPDSSSGYFMNAWLAQCSGIVPADYVQKKITANQAVTYPRDWTNNLDLANGPYAINQKNIIFNNFGMQVEVLRLGYQDGIAGERYLVQDLGALKTLNRTWKPASWMPTGGIFKVANGLGAQTDWHLNGDPRLNFLASSWNQKQSASALPLLPQETNKVWSDSSNLYKDDLQGMEDTSKWWTADKNHFMTSVLKAPSGSTAYRPSPAKGQPAMLSYSELGMVALGRPWQTLRLYKDSIDPNKPNDIPLLEMVDIGGIPTIRKDELDTQLVDGLVNVASPKKGALASLFQDTKYVPPQQVQNLVDAVLQSSKRPFSKASDIFLDGTLLNTGTTDYEKELLAAQVIPVATLRSNVFAVYIVGEARRNDRTVSRVMLKANVEFKRVQSADGPKISAIVLKEEFL